MSDRPSPTRVNEARQNLASHAITTAKLNGRVYTPIDLARATVRRLRWPDVPSAHLVDPACGDGVFLQAAVETLESQGRPELVSLVEGWDVDEDALAACVARLESVCSRLGLTQRPRLRHRDALHATEASTYAAVVGNPPYLESKRMPDRVKGYIREHFPLAGTGAFDLYGAFTELALRLARDTDGEVAFVLPNRLLVTNSTGRLRRALLARGELGITDLSEERVFQDAAVYPVVLRSDASRPAQLVLEDVDGVPSLDLPVELVERLGGRIPMPRPALRPLVERLLDDTTLEPLSARLEVRWTCSFHRRGLRDRYIFAARPPGPHARRFLGGARFSGNREVRPFAIDWAGSWIDFDTERARLDRNGLPAAEIFEAPKAVVPQNVRRPRAALDTTGLVLKDTFLAVRVRDASESVVWLEWFVLVVNSAFFHHLYEALYGGTRKGAAYLHVLGSYLHPLPLPAPPDGVSELHAALCERPPCPELIAQAEEMVREAYGLTPAEAEVLDALPLPA